MKCRVHCDNSLDIGKVVGINNPFRRDGNDVSGYLVEGF
jgi:hypothetical protein